MFDVMADWLTVPLLNAEAGNPPQAARPRASLDRALRRVHARKDGKDILISIQSEREWKKLCAEVLRQPDLPNDPRLCNGVERVKNRAFTDQTVADIFGSLTRDDLLATSGQTPTSPSPRSTRWPTCRRHPHLRRIEVDDAERHGQLSGAGGDLRRRRRATTARCRRSAKPDDAKSN